MDSYKLTQLQNQTQKTFQDTSPSKKYYLKKELKPSSIEKNNINKMIS